MSLANLEKTLITCIRYYQERNNDDKVARLKDRLRVCRSKSMTSHDGFVAPPQEN